VRVEVDFRRELRLGEEVEIRTRALSAGASSLTIGQRMVTADEGDGPVLYAEARVVLVWIGPDGRPMRVPQDVRGAFGLPPRPGRPGSVTS